MGRGEGADLLGHQAEGRQVVKTTPLLVAALALIRAVAVKVFGVGEVVAGCALGTEGLDDCIEGVDVE